jgi:hypothetical protein
MRMTLKYFVWIVAAVALALSSPVFAQFGGKAGDVVIYAVTYNGSGDFQAVPPTTTNTAANQAAFRVVDLNTVPFTGSDPFPLQRQVLYMTDKETFQIGTDFEGTIGLHRLVLYNVKIYEFEGITNPSGQLLGLPNTLIDFPLGLDLQDDLAVQTLKVVTWFPGPWPFIAVTDHPGPLVPPGLTGFQYLFTAPGLVKVCSLLSWQNMSVAYPGAGWQEGVDQKMLETDSSIGMTIRQIRLRPGTQTPPFRFGGHTHFFVLQGGVNITPAGGAASPMSKYFYAYLPESFTVTLANPEPLGRTGAP